MFTELNDELKPGKIRWLISCDESGVHGAQYYGFGTLWMKWQRRGDFAADFRDICEKHGFQGECKWKKANSWRSFNFYIDLIDYFFKKRWILFHCIIIRKAIIDMSYHRNDFDLARRKHFNMFLTNKIEKSVLAYPNRDQEYRIWVDPIASRYRKADEAVQVIANNVLNQGLKQINKVESVVTKDSRLTPTIQLCDFLLGAVIESWQGNASSEYKHRLREIIAEYLGWSSLDSDTQRDEKKFNIWYFYDPTKGPREVNTRPVNLKYQF